MSKDREQHRIEAANQLATQKLCANLAPAVNRQWMNPTPEFNFKNCPVLQFHVVVEKGSVERSINRLKSNGRMVRT